MRKKTVTNRWMTLLLAGLLLLAAGCGGNGGPLNPNTPVTITLWHYYSGETLDALEDNIALFNQTLGAEAGVRVQPQAMGSIAELEQHITASVQGLEGAQPLPYQLER